MSQNKDQSDSDDTVNPFEGVEEAVKDSIRKKIEEHKQQIETKRINRLQSRVEYMMLLIHSLQKLTKHILDVTKVEVPPQLSLQKIRKMREKQTQSSSPPEESKGYSRTCKKTGKNRSKDSQLIDLDTTQVVAPEIFQQTKREELRVEQDGAKLMKGYAFRTSRIRKKACNDGEAEDVEEGEPQEVEDEDSKKERVQMKRPHRMKHTYHRSKKMIVVEKLVLGQITMADAKKILHIPEVNINRMVEQYMTQLD